MTKICEFKNCKKRAYYGYDKLIYCYTHKLNNMISLHSRYCININCTNIASFGYKNGFRNYCNKHKLENMIRLNIKSCKLCNKLANYGYNNGREYCRDHKLENMINFNVKYCAFPNCKKSAQYSSFPKEYCKSHKN